MKTPKEYYKDHEIENGESEEQIEEVINDMDETFFLMEDYANAVLRADKGRVIGILKAKISKLEAEIKESDKKTHSWDTRLNARIFAYADAALIVKNTNS